MAGGLITGYLTHAEMVAQWESRLDGTRRLRAIRPVQQERTGLASPRDGRRRSGPTRCVWRHSESGRAACGQLGPEHTRRLSGTTPGDRWNGIPSNCHRLAHACFRKRQPSRPRTGDTPSGCQRVATYAGGRPLATPCCRQPDPCEWNPPDSQGLRSTMSSRQADGAAPVSLQS